MPKRSAGILMFRRRGGEVEVLLMHPGGPFWAKKDLGAWSIPKGEYSEGEDALAVAKREFEEETGRRGVKTIARGRFRPRDADLEPVRTGMAAEERAQGVVSRSRPRAMVFTPRRPAEDSRGAGRVHHLAARRYRQVTVVLNDRPSTWRPAAGAAHSVFRRKCARQCARRPRHGRPCVRRSRSPDASASGQAADAAP